MAFKDVDCTETTSSSVLMDEETRTVSISGTIDADTYSGVLFALQSLDRRKGQITIFINSEGGSVYSGLGIYDLISACSNKVVGVAVGSCMSAAVTILMACDVRLASPECRFMVHEVQGSVAEMSASLVHHYVGEWEELDKRLKEILCASSGLTQKEIEGLCKEDSFLSTEVAKGYEIIDGVFTSFKNLKRRSR